MSKGRPASREMSRFRLILADPSISGGSIMQTTNLRLPLTSEQIIALLNEKPGYKFQDLCTLRGVSNTPDISSGELRLTGVDGARKIPLHSDKDIEAFLGGLQFTKFPVIEAQLPLENLLAKPSEHHQRGVDAGRKRGRDPRDQVEELEDANFKLTRATDRVERRLAELERVLASNDEKNQRAINKSMREIMSTVETSMKDMDAKVDALKGDDAAILAELDVVRQHGFAVEQQDKDHHKELLEQFDAFATRVDSTFDEVNDAIDKLRAEDARINAEAVETKQNHQEQLDAHLDELQRLEEIKVSVAVWQKEEEAMAERITQDLAALEKQLSEDIADLNGRFKAEQQFSQERFDKETSERQAGDQELHRQLDETTQRLDEELRRQDEAMKAGFKAAEEALENVRAELAKSIDDKVTDLSNKTEKRFDQTDHTIAHKDEKINKRTDELTGKTEATFTSMNEKVDAMANEERARLSQIVQDFNESTTKLRADMRAEIERVRSDYEQDAARLDADLGDLHMKHDVTKQEINFFQTKLKEQRDWTDQQLSENSTATRAAAVDSQEGLAATTKMLHALRDDAVSFREKMAKYISVLQHSSDSQGDAINSLEINRTRMRAELDALIGDHKAYTGDMDGWADDVRMKVERLFRALEPARVEWRICRASQRAKELKKPLAVKSPGFSVKGIREGHMEFFPDGHNNSPAGKTVLRVFLPPQAHIRYQCWVGKNTEGPREHEPGDNLSVDICMDDWKEQVDEDGSVPVRLEVLRDYNNDDQSLAREMRVESA